MDRRNFIITSTGALAWLVFPPVGCTSSEKELIRVITPPLSLSTIHDSTTITQLGKSYLEKYPSENSASQLVDLITKETGSDPDELQEKIKQDFREGNTVILEGWLFSITEARQCALFSLINN